MPGDKDAFFNGYNPFSGGGMSSYGIILRFRHGSYSGWLGIEMTAGASIANSHLIMLITTYDNFPTESGLWRILNV